MELWIRSQDRETLMLANHLDIYCLGDGTPEYYIEECGVDMGCYKNKERALEILDDIEDKLINCAFAKKQNGLGEVLDFMPNSIYVYKMPKE